MSNIASSMTASSGPSTIASQLAQASIQDAQNLLSTRLQNTNAVSTGLTKLKSALLAFDNALNSLSGTKGLAQSTASFGTAGFGSATATSSAVSGTYSVFVEQVATASQVAFDLPAGPIDPTKLAGTTATGVLTVNMGVIKDADGNPVPDAANNPIPNPIFTVDLTQADTDKNGDLSPAEIARAINQASGNAGKVTAMVITAGGTSRLVLTAANTGVDSAIALDTSQLATAGGLQASLSNLQTLVQAQDAVVDFGGGLKQVQASNTFTNISGVSMTFTQAQAVGSAPLSLTVASDDTGTVANVQKFVDAYNALNKALDPLTATASADGSTAAGPFATDAGVRALRNSLSDRVRQQMGGLRLSDLGIQIGGLDGVMSLSKPDTLRNTLLKRPDALDAFFGKTGITTSSGILGSLDKYLQGWVDVTNGQIQRRTDSNNSVQKSIQSRQTRLQDQYTQAYNRYLKQFTALQTLQDQMGQTSGMFASLFPSQSGN